MFKRTKGYFLLTMLVLTGLAGRLNNPTLSTKERRLLVEDLKTSRKHLLNTVEGLNAKQLNYKLEGRSVKDYMHLLAEQEDQLIRNFQEAVSRENLSSERYVADRELNTFLQPSSTPRYSHATYKSALACYKTGSSKLLRYAKTTTDYVRGLHSPSNQLDAYQILTLTGMHTRYYTDRIEALLKSPAFPR